MNLKTLIPRLAIFFIGLPLIAFIVLGLPQYQHLAINITTVVFSALGAAELAGMLKKKNLKIPAGEAAVLGAAVPAAITAMVSFGAPVMTAPAALAAAASWILVSRIFSPEQELDDYLGRAAAGFAALVYPGLFLGWIIPLGLLPRADMVILTFLLVVFANDSLAWASGMLFGKKNRGIIPASPNKSISGFTGGLTASALIGLGAAYFFPGVFQPRYMPALPAGLALGLATGIAASLGDLGESALKRSAGVKDSGFLIPGRGGVLDSIDSLSLAAPVFYLAFRLLFS
ncbi:MAG: phosphatidate cytidylyltransferase [Treponema sp.]|jgi:phosphatidate cytidylyltransferase|nr:phosphatidate cytidylyltransferase [Treponema sp.]